MLLDIQSQHPMNNNNGNLIVAVHNGHLQHTSPNPKKILGRHRGLLSTQAAAAKLKPSMGGEDKARYSSPPGRTRWDSYVRNRKK